jgi:hydroxyacylglutathione hydrolase
MSFVISDLKSPEVNLMVFTGDALFVDEVGRTDLSGEHEVGRLAGNLYDSLHGKLLPLGDEVIICPAHGAGSICGKHISSRDESTLGIEKLHNPWLKIKNKDEFVRLKEAEKHERPHYFRQMEKYNLEGPPLLKNLPVPEPLRPAEFKVKVERGVPVVDTSLPAAFGGAHIRGSYSIWTEGLPVFAGWVLPYDRPMVLVMENKVDPDMAVRYLVRAGYDRIEGFLYGGMESWINSGYPVEHATVLSIHEMKSMLDAGEDIRVLDVREDDEWDSGHIEGAVHSFVGHLEEKTGSIPRDKPVVVICSVGHRSGLGTSILLRAGFERVYNVIGGYTAWNAAGYPLVKN